MEDGLDIVANRSWTPGINITDKCFHTIPSSDIITHPKQFRHPKASGITIFSVSQDKKYDSTLVMTQETATWTAPAVKTWQMLSMDI